MNKHKGFTLVELLAVIVILGILLSISVVAVGKIKKTQDEENYKNVLSSILTGSKNYIADHPEKIDTGCVSDKSENDKLVACASTCTKNKKNIWCTLISVKGLINNGYVDIDEENSLYNDLINATNDNTFNSRSVRIEKCDNSSKLVYKLYDLRDENKKTYNDCGCKEQEVGDSKTLCTD